MMTVFATPRVTFLSVMRLGRYIPSRIPVCGLTLSSRCISLR